MTRCPTCGLQYLARVLVAHIQTLAHIAARTAQFPNGYIVETSGKPDLWQRGRRDMT